MSSLYGGVQSSVTVDLSTLRSAPTSLTIDLPTGEVMTATLDQFKARAGYLDYENNIPDPSAATQSYLWQGHTATNGHVILTVEGNEICGSMTNGIQRYTIEYSPNLQYGEYMLAQVEDNYLEYNETEIDFSNQSFSSSASESSTSRVSHGVQGAGFNESIRMGVFYTQQLLADMGGNLNAVRACTVNGFDQTNQIFQSQGIPVEIDTTDFTFDLFAISGNPIILTPIDPTITDPYQYLQQSKQQLSEALGNATINYFKNFRDTNDIDVIAVMIESDIATCGLATRMPKGAFGPQFGNDSQVKTNSMAVRRNCGVADYAMAHELAHVMGGCHDRSTQAAQTCYLDSRAHFENGVKRSLLAAKTFYNADAEIQDNCPNGCPLQPIYSNDDPGEFGLPNNPERDYRTANTQVLREAAAFIGGFRPMTDMQLSRVSIPSNLPGRTTAHKFSVQKSGSNKASDVRLTIAFGPNAPSFFVNLTKIIPAGTSCSQVMVGNDNQFSFDKIPTEGGGYYHYQCDFGTIEDNAVRSVEFYLNTVSKMASFDLHIDAFLDLNTTETSYANNDSAITHSGF